MSRRSTVVGWLIVCVSLLAAIFAALTIIGYMRLTDTVQSLSHTVELQKQGIRSVQTQNDKLIEDNDRLIKDIATLLQEEREGDAEREAAISDAITRIIQGIEEGNQETQEAIEEIRRLARRTNEVSERLDRLITEAQKRQQRRDSREANQPPPHHHHPPPEGGDNDQPPPIAPPPKEEECTLSVLDLCLE